MRCHSECVRRQSYSIHGASTLREVIWFVQLVSRFQSYTVDLLRRCIERLLKMGLKWRWAMLRKLICWHFDFIAKSIEKWNRLLNTHRQKGSESLASARAQSLQHFSSHSTAERWLHWVRDVWCTDSAKLRSADWFAFLILAISASMGARTMYKVQWRCVCSSG